MAKARRKVRQVIEWCVIWSYDRGMRLIIGLTCVATLAGCGGEAGLFKGQGLFGSRAEINNATPGATPTPVSATTPDTGTATTNGDAPPANTVGTPDPFQTAIVNPDEDGGPDANKPATDGRLGSTVASLGDPSKEGFWVKTSLVSAPTSGRVVYVTSGRSVQVELIPLDGPAGGGSQISMAAMRLLDAPLTGLPELVVYGS